MADFAPELLKKIETEFHNRATLNPEIHTFLKKMDTENVRLEDVHDYTENLGEILSDVLQRNLNEAVLPGGKLYWNTAQETIKPMLEEIHKQTNNTAAKVQRQIDQADGIGLNTVEPEFPAERINGLLNKAVSAQSPEELSKWLGEPIVNASESFFDNFVMENAEFRYKLGMTPKIVRKLGRSERRKARTGQKYEIPCNFCKNLDSVK